MLTSWITRFNTACGYIKFGKPSFFITIQFSKQRLFERIEHNVLKRRVWVINYLMIRLR